VVMARIVLRNDSLFGGDKKHGKRRTRDTRRSTQGLPPQHYAVFKERHHEASIKLEGRNEAMAAAVAEYLENELESVGLTGVEDKLQDGVKSTLELLRNAGIKIRMLTRDKIKTAGAFKLPYSRNWWYGIRISMKLSNVSVI